MTKDAFWKQENDLKCRMCVIACLNANTLARHQTLIRRLLILFFSPFLDAKVKYKGQNMPQMDKGGVLERYYYQNHILTHFVS